MCCQELLQDIYCRRNNQNNLFDAPYGWGVLEPYNNQ